MTNEIKKAEFEAIRVEQQAEMAQAIAGKIRLQIKACLHRIEVETKIIDELSIKAEAKPALWSKYHVAETKVEDLKRKFKNKKAEAGASKNIVEANELEKELRKATSNAKKAKLEAEEADSANEARVKHLKILAQTEAEMKLKNDEFKTRELEAKARYSQAGAKKAEVKALKAGNAILAKALKEEALAYKIEAKTLEEESKLIKKSGKPTHNKTTKQSKQEDNNQPSQTKFIEKKHLSTKGLLSIVHESFRDVPDKKINAENSQSNITLADCLMSGLAVFKLKFPSLLQFDKETKDEEGCIRGNLKELYQVNKAPCDTYMRERLDEVNPVYLRPAFKKIFAALQRGKELEKYKFLDDYYLASGDGTGLFSSKSINCSDCCAKHHRDGSNTYYHQMMSAVIVHPDYSTVIPFCPEPITNKDGSDKNDCERNASERLYRHIRREHPHLPLIITEDALGSNGPHIRLLKELDMRFILVVKPDGNKSLFEYLKGIQLEEHIHTDNDFSYKIKFINEIPLNETHNDLLVNYFELWVYNKNGDLKYHNSWITDIKITNNNVYRLCQGGRAKWKIENETFNTLKNQDYHFEHNFGHGFKHLSTVFALLMFLAFLTDQIEQSCCGMFQAALSKMGSKIRLWSKMRAYFITLYINSWEEFWRGIAFGIEGKSLTPLTSVLDTS